MREYEVIKEFYGDRVAERSQVPLIQHIDEGLRVLLEIEADPLAMRAFCLHPIVQNNEPVDVSWSPAFRLAQVYASAANAYLCCEETDHVRWVHQLGDRVMHLPRLVAQMLYADKVQNRKDFVMYHKDTHPRAAQLTQYFDLWISYLGKMATAKLAVPIRPGMGNDSEGYRHDLGLGRGNRLGYVSVCLWANHDDDDGTEARRKEIDARLATLFQNDPVLQAVLAEDAAARPNKVDGPLPWEVPDV